MEIAKSLHLLFETVFNGRKDLRKSLIPKISVNNSNVSITLKHAVDFQTLIFPDKSKMMFCLLILSTK